MSDKIFGSWYFMIAAQKQDSHIPVKYNCIRLLREKRGKSHHTNGFSKAPKSRIADLGGGWNKQWKV